MAQWAVIIPADQWAAERLFHHDTVAVPGTTGVDPAPGDDALLVAGGADPCAVAVATIREARTGALLVGYRRRAFDEPVPVEDLKLSEAVTALDRVDFDRVAARVGGRRVMTDWLVSVAMPIEAAQPAEAVRQFWSYVRELGPAELPALVWPSGKELAMQAFVLGTEANQDPEEEDD
ncbi:hypothetical protein [Mangrovihabitans endophyticus]|uniref:Uncharacterized protein n=1 Tax=Mangrovihabitans endophyticus TaxID=1751298 RepID=A0A8J3FMF6_9ACTN|nr:hypothetical protein [Mangrovihabitans endophyticus]GGK83426.1 hypothetical protein GCM10012284_16910 [Mangrovihabitans endophyticus]